MWLYVVMGALVAGGAGALAYRRRSNAAAAAERKRSSPPLDHQPLQFRQAAQRARKRSASASTKSATIDPSAIRDDVKSIPTTKRHIWLLDLPIGHIATDDQLAKELGIEPGLGWHRHRSLIMAILAGPRDFYMYKTGPRLRIPPGSSATGALPPISPQAVPILSACEGGWRFEGFFRLGRPAKASIACRAIEGVPPELAALTKYREDW